MDQAAPSRADLEAANRVQAFAAGQRVPDPDEVTVGLYVLQQRNVVEDPDQREESRAYAISEWRRAVHAEGWLDRTRTPGSSILPPPEYRGRTGLPWAWWYVWGRVLK